jgi:membrane protein YqaA with SNARE-associated domain
MQDAPPDRGRMTPGMTLDALWPLLVMLASAFAAATLLVLPSEAILLAQIKAGLAPTWALFVAATIGNVAGSAFNWWLGLNARRFEARRWFPFSPQAIESASDRFRRFGLWSLLLAWVPIIGDPLTFIAGVLRVPFRYFLPLVAIGKGARYAILAASL